MLGLVLLGEPERVTPPGVEVRPSGEDEFEPWLDIVLHGFAHPDTQGVPLHGELAREVIAGAGRDFAAAGGIRYIALRDDSARAPPPGGAGRSAGVRPGNSRRAIGWTWASSSESSKPGGTMMQ